MAGQITQTNTTPFARLDVDPVTLDIIENALRNARVEMDATLFRTAMSPGIREQGDAFPMIANVDGKMVVGQFGWEAAVWSFAEIPARRERTLVDAQAPDFEIADRSGKVIRMADLKGKKALIVTWSSW